MKSELRLHAVLLSPLLNSVILILFFFLKKNFKIYITVSPTKPGPDVHYYKFKTTLLLRKHSFKNIFKRTLHIPMGFLYLKVLFYKSWNYYSQHPHV